MGAPRRSSLGNLAGVVSQREVGVGLRDWALLDGRTDPTSVRASCVCECVSAVHVTYIVMAAA